MQSNIDKLPKKYLHIFGPEAWHLSVLTSTELLFSFSETSLMELQGEYFDSSFNKLPSAT